MSDGRVPPPGRQDAPVVERPVRVESLEGGFAWVVADRAGGCSGCPEKGGCGHAALLGEAPPIRLKVDNRLNARPGEWVAIGLPSSGLIASLGVAYGLPVLGFLAGTLAGSAFGGTAAAMLGGVCGLGLAFLAGRRLCAAGRGRATPVMLRKVPPPAGPCGT